MTPREVLALCRQNEIQAIDLRFMDFPGTQKHFTVSSGSLTEKSFEEGLTFDGSSIRGWQAINESDMLVIPQADTAMVDPFMKSTLSMTCNVRDPITGKDYPRDPRNVARKAEMYMRSLGIADTAIFGLEPEFFVFDEVRFDVNEHEGYYHLDSIEGAWNRGRSHAHPNQGQRIRRREGYFSMPPADTLQDVRTEIMLICQSCGIEIEGQHHEVATAGQCEVDLKFAPLLTAADRLLRFKYIARNVAARYGKSATFMAKPLWNENGSGLHMHFSLWQEGRTLFAGSGYGGLSDLALHALGGILKHTPALSAFCSPTTNSYKRLVSGFDAPVNLTYSFRNRSAAVRIPAQTSAPETRRFEYRCPDPTCNPYLAMAGVLMAALDGIQNRIDPGLPLDKDIYDLAPEEMEGYPQMPVSLEAALAALQDDHEFLLRGDVFTEDVIETWLRYKGTQEVNALRERPHPWEFTMYYDT